MFSAVQWWTDFWTWVNENQLAATVIGTLVAAATLAVLTRLPKIGPGVRRAFKWAGERTVRVVGWLWSWRPVSARRHGRTVTFFTRIVAESNAARQELATRADDALDQIQSSIPDLALTLSNQLHDERRRAETLVHAVEDLHRGQEALKLEIDALKVELGALAESSLTAEAEARKRTVEAESIQQPHAPEPRWRLVSPRNRTDNNQYDGKYIVQNLVESSIARNVRLDNDGVGHFDFVDGAYWPDVSGLSTVTLDGEITAADTEGDVRLSLTWLDENNQTRTQLYWLNTDGSVKPIHQSRLDF